MHIIVCSDNPAVRDAVSGHLGDHAARLTVCESGMELLGAVRALDADLVILDLGTHGLGGLLLVSAIQELSPDVSIFAVSATPDVDGRPLVQRGIPHVVLGSEHDGELHSLLVQLAGRRGAALGAGSR
jgi:DNA-binding response OmpR family regulator